MGYLEHDTSLSLQKKYEKVKKLLEEESRHDPETEPYKSKYAARALLEEMKTTLLSELDYNINNTDANYEQVESMYCAVLLLSGSVSVDTEELSRGEEDLNLSLERIQKISSSKAVLVELATLNQLGLLWSQRGDSKKSHEFFTRAEKLYFDFKCLTGALPVEISELFGITSADEKGQDSLEKMHTLTLYYLAQVHGTMGNPVKSAVYCHTTLKRQLESKDYDAIEWALNSATLAQFFMERNVFHEARHHLAAASFILDKYQEGLDHEKCNEEEMEAKKERLKHRGADVARCWAKYGLMLLTASRDRLMESSDDDAPPSNSEETNKPPDELLGLKFSELNVTLYEEQVTDGFILTYDDARVVFLNSQEWLNKASAFYTLEDHASDHVQIVQDMSQLYKGLVFFEEDEERQAKMHKRRVDLLQAVVKELNPKYYLSPCRQIWFELGEIQSAILDVKLGRLQALTETPSPHALQKINHLAEQAIDGYNQFLDSLRDPKSKEMPKVFTSDLERPALLAYFYLGRLYNKLITPDKATKIAYFKNSINYFQMVVDYCERNESGREQVAVELGVCKDMANLLPLKMKKIAESMNT